MLWSPPPRVLVFLALINITNSTYQFFFIYSIGHHVDQTKDDILKQHKINKRLLQLFLESELGRMAVWINPMNTPGYGNSASVVNNVEKLLFTDVSWFREIYMIISYGYEI